MGLRRLTIGTRIAIAVAIPTFALMATLTQRIAEAGVRRTDAAAQLDAIVALEAVAAVQADLHLVELIEVGWAADAVADDVGLERRFLVAATLEGAWDLYMPAYLAADNALADLPGPAAASIGEERLAVLAAQRVLVDETMAAVDAGDVDAELVDRLADARDAADLALSDLAIESGISAWSTYPASVEVSRATALEFGHLVPALLGVHTIDATGLAFLDGRRANATERVVYNLDASRRPEVVAIFDSEAYDQWSGALAAALAVLEGDAPPWGLLEVVQFSETAIALGEQIDLVTGAVVADVRADALAEVDEARAEARNLTIAIAAVALGSIVTVGALLVSIRRPVRQLTERTSAIARGDLEGAPIAIEGRDELTDLGRLIEDVVGAMTHLDHQVRAISEGRLDDPTLGRSAPGLLGAFVAERVQELKLASGALAEEANRDALTGLLNRRGLLAAAELLDPEAPAVVLFVDLDRFKSVNDDFGHRHGDAVLQEVAARLDAASRDRDVAARLGGDEFVLVAVGVPEVAVAEDLARRLELSIRRPIAVDGVTHHIGCSVGVAWLDASEAFSETLERADLAMIGVKRRHREDARRDQTRRAEGAGPAARR